ncbi:MAG: Ig-like domain-containing protein [Gemmatimonadetes bacterium]|nr:Ig-like domain-containing protein [Gemmatimonadota bacterium]
MRGKLIRGALARWRSLDTSVVAVDSLGLATAVHPGVATTEARLDGVAAKLPVRVTPVLGSIAAGAGHDQHAPASTQLPMPVGVRTLSRQGQPIGDVLVHAVVDAGTLESDTARSGADGVARFRWTLGDRPGPQRLTASADEIDSTLVVGAEADPVERNTRFVLVDSIPTGPASAPLPRPVTVRLTDTLGQVLTDVPIRWLAQDGSRLVGGAARTDSLGLASATWTLGPKVGGNRGRILAGPVNTPAFAFTTRSLAGEPATIAVLTGDRQRLPVARAITVRVKVADAQGNVAAAVPLQTVLTAGSVVLTDPVTRADGTARLQWTLGPTAGAQTLELRAGPAKVQLSATALPAPAAQVEIVAPTISIVSAAQVRVVAVVSDSLGNPISGNVVQPRVAMGSVAPLRATTDAQGRASFTWTLAKRAGDQTITVRAAGVRVNATKTLRKAGPR